MLRGKKTLVFLSIFVILAAVGAWALLQKEARIHNTGKVRTMGVEAYWETECINIVQEID